MRHLIADEDIPRPIIEKLRRRGFSVFSVDEEMKGSLDEDIVEKANDLNQPIVTFDSDFFEYGSHPGILYITQRTNYDRIVAAVDDIVTKLDNKEIKNTVIQINPSDYSR
ncbi:MAG: DUF5615 family PIN-like protein [Candidatus Nanohaloarchaea archaeon]